MKKPVSTDRFPLHACLYQNSSAKNLDLPEVASHLRGKGLFKEVNIRTSVFKGHENKLNEISKKLAETHIRNLETSERNFDIREDDIEFEKSLISGEISGLTNELYDGFRLSKTFTDLIKEDELKDSYLHIIFTDRFFATWKSATQRYHARVSVYGFPSVISTTGVVDAPARPFGSYQIERIDTNDDSSNLQMVDNSGKFEGDFVNYEDDRLTDIMKGYTMQAVFYHLHLEAFCSNKECALYNPHLQKNILRSKLSTPEFCEKHQEVLKKLQAQAEENF